MGSRWREGQGSDLGVLVGPDGTSGLDFVLKAVGRLQRVLNRKVPESNLMLWFIYFPPGGVRVAEVKRGHRESGRWLGVATVVEGAKLTCLPFLYPSLNTFL